MASEWDVVSHTKNDWDVVEHSPIEAIVSGAKGTLAAAGDFASGLVKIPAAAMLAVGGKLASPSTPLQTTWEAAQNAMEETYPSFGKDRQENLGYKVPMYPFQKYGEGVQYVANKASLGNKDIEGALNIVGQFAPIPFIKSAGKGAKAIIETLDPGLRKIGKVSPAETIATNIKGLKPETPPIPAESPFQPDTYYVLDKNGKPRPATPKELKQMQARDNATVDQINAGLNRQGTPGSETTMAVNNEGQAYPMDTVTEQARIAQDQQHAAAVDEALTNYFTAERYRNADAAIADRQAALEREMQLRVEAEKRGRVLGPTANELESQPTGYSDWVVKQQQLAEQRQPGNNTPMEMESPYPVDATQFPQVFQEGIPKYEGGIDMPIEDRVGTQTLPLEMLDILNKDTSPRTPLPQQILDILNTPKGAQSAWQNLVDWSNSPSEPINQRRGRQGGGQGGAMSQDFLKTGFRALNKALSALSDAKWVQDRFPTAFYMSNPDGTPRIELHGTTHAFKDRPRGRYEGLHSGTAGPATIKASANEGKVRNERTVQYLPTETKTGSSAVYPVVYRKGNYPFVKKDFGTWDPTQLQQNRKFALAIKNHLEGKMSFYDVESILHDWWDGIKDISMSPEEMNKSFAKVLKDNFGIDGFEYLNTYESPKRNLKEAFYSGNTTDRGLRLSSKMEHPTSLVTWDDNNVESLFGDTRQDRLGAGHTDPTKQGGYFGPRSQRGSADFDLATLGIPALAEKLFGFGKKRLSDKTDYVRSNIPGMKAESDLIMKPPTSQEMIDRQKAAGMTAENDLGDATRITKYLQSGLQHASEKWFQNAPILRDIGRAFKYATAKEAFANRTLVQPIEKMNTRLSSDEQIHLATALREANKNKVPFTEEQLRETGVSQKVINAYKAHIDGMAKALEVQNAQRIAQEKKPLTAEEAYMSASFVGPYHIAVYPKGKTSGPVWYVQTQSALEAKKTVVYLKETLKDNPDVDVSKLDYTYKPSGINQGKYGQSFHPDAIDMYHEVMELFKGDPIADAVNSALKSYLQERGYMSYGQAVHFKQKTGVRGFEGDKPWKSDIDNARDLLAAQTRYMSNAHKWAAWQEVNQSLREVFSNPELTENMPNTMALAKAYYMKHMGVDTNLLRGIENAASNGLSWVGSKLGREVSGNLTRALTQDFKHFTYMTLLGFSRMFVYATPIQAIPGYWAELVNLKRTGEVKLTEMATMKAIQETLSGISGGITLSEKTVLPGQREMYRWGKANDIIKENFTDEFADLSRSKVVRGLSIGFDRSISMADSAFRAPIFMSLAGLLERSRSYATKELAWRRAGELTENIMINMRKTESPLVYDKFGSVGHLAQTFTQPIYNFYNNISRFARQSLPVAMLYIGLWGILGGFLNLPGMKEAEQSLELVKDLALNSGSKMGLDIYNTVKDLSMRGFISRHYDDANTFAQLAMVGAASKISGLDFRSRFQQEFPLNASPLYQEAKEWASTAAIISDPLNPNKWAEAGYKLSPPAAREILETTLPQFRTGVQPSNGDVGFKNPNHLTNTERYLTRTPNELETRKWIGGRSLTESMRLDRQYLGKQDTARQSSATKLATSLFMEALDQGNVERQKAILATASKISPSLPRILSQIQRDKENQALTWGQRLPLHMEGDIEKQVQYKRLQDMYGRDRMPKH